MKVTVAGCGRWGSFIAWYLDHIGKEVTLYGRSSSGHMQRFLAERKNEYLELPESIRLSTDLACAEEAEVIVISVGAQSLRAFLGELNACNLQGKTIVLCMKGIEMETGKRLSEIVKEKLKTVCPIAVWLGPGHVQEFYRGIPNCMVIDSENEETKRWLVEEFSGSLIRFYYGQDLIGNEIGAAAKNVIGIAAGMLDGLKLHTLKGALMSRGTREVSRLIAALGGNEISAYGLCHLGDYEATVFSEHSHNRKFGELFVQGKDYGELAEGYYTVRAIMLLKERHHVDMPICETVYRILYEKADMNEEFTRLFSRRLKYEMN
ncbi:MAG: NAD(P)H-dependent glycerol-3-phosphate dehydrogenase [Lachnospiraceae bacterium]|nr:NAD(P)H-dependent glycerol-3-phosphate dehydrogenase [Lachnospiraceae bacterium]